MAETIRLIGAVVMRHPLDSPYALESFRSEVEHEYGDKAAAIVNRYAAPGSLAELQVGLPHNWMAHVSEDERYVILGVLAKNPGTVALVTLKFELREDES